MISERNNFICLREIIYKRPSEVNLKISTNRESPFKSVYYLQFHHLDSNCLLIFPLLTTFQNEEETSFFISIFIISFFPVSCLVYSERDGGGEGGREREEQERNQRRKRLLSEPLSSPLPYLLLPSPLLS